MLVSALSATLAAGLWLGAHRLPAQSVACAAPLQPSALLCEPPPAPARPRLVVRKAHYTDELLDPFARRK